MPTPVVFNNSSYLAAYLGGDNDGVNNSIFNVQQLGDADYFVNGTVNNPGDPVTFTNQADPTAVITVYATNLDDPNHIVFTQNADGTGFGLLASNVPLTVGDNITFGETSLGDYQVPCYCTGTLLRTVDGDVAVENLRVGDLVVTASGEHRPIKWIGHSALDCRSHANPAAARPIRIRKDAFGPGKPAQDLLVSPAHAICLDLLGEVLIPASALVNGSTVTQEEVEEVTYWHVELDSHDILIANGQPSESYLEMGNRGFFLDAAASALPDAPVRSHDGYCRPFHDGGPVVEAVRAQMQRHAEAIGWQMAASEAWAEVHLEVDGEIVRPAVRDLTARFMLPASAREVWLVSPTSVPRHVGESGDERVLGLSVVGLTLDDGLGEPRIVALDDPRLGEGFHAPEEAGAARRWRWTSGRARLPAELLAGLTDTVFLRVELACAPLPRWQAPASAREAIQPTRIGRTLTLVASAA
ncbi:hypothetical protein M446_2933 [Methylobacterium sp. 4-46]|nr:hypothetical protein M446_2933 [Methylobacterium sp. 4-46]